jgi:hypothetical protein
MSAIRGRPEVLHPPACQVRFSNKTTSVPFKAGVIAPGGLIWPGGICGGAVSR